jgi:hypothetical protein
MGTGDGEFVGRTLRQQTARIIQDLQRLVSGVGNSGHNLEILYTGDGSRLNPEARLAKYIWLQLKRSSIIQIFG